MSVPGATLEQNTEIADVLMAELNKGIPLDDVLHAAKIMKDELTSKVAAVAAQVKGGGGADA